MGLYRKLSERVMELFDGKESQELILKVFNFSENFLYLASFLTFITIYKQEFSRVRSILKKVEGKYDIFFVSEFDVKPPLVSVNENTSLSINLRICDYEKCFEIHKTFDL